MADRMIHPGPRAAERMQAVRCTLRPVTGALPAGATVMEGVAALFDRHGCRGGVLFLDGVVCEPMDYVLPARSTDGVHAAWYSEPLRPRGRMTVLRATATVGLRDGAAFLHCHGLWSGTDGVARMGHLLPADSIVAADAAVAGLGSEDGWFQALPDEETAFTLFQPAGGTLSGDGVLARLRPGVDVVAGIEELARQHGIADARVHGVGSIDHIRFADGGRVDCLATELRFAGAVLAGGRATLPIEVVDIDGGIHAGTLARDGNPVGVTLEIIIEPRRAA